MLFQGVFFYFGCGQFFELFFVRLVGRVYLDGFYDDGEGVVLVVSGQQVLVDFIEGEVFVVKVFEVGLFCDEIFFWRDIERGKDGRR